MRWTPGNRDNVEDMRGRSGAVPLGIGGLLVLAVLSWATGTNFFALLGTGDGQPGSAGSTGAVQSSPQEERTMDFVDAVARDVQTTWAGALGSRYRKTTVVVFRDEIHGACAEVTVKAINQLGVETTSAVAVVSLAETRIS